MNEAEVSSFAMAKRVVTVAGGLHSALSERSGSICAAQSKECCSFASHYCSNLAA